jgi:hypothetical protein
MHATLSQTALQLDGVQNVGGLGLAVGRPFVVITLFEVDVLENHRRHWVGSSIQYISFSTGKVSYTSLMKSRFVQGSFRPWHRSVGVTTFLTEGTTGVDFNG